MIKDAIRFPLDQPIDDASLVYRPWGTRTLKIRVSTQSDSPPLRIRPKGMRSEDIDEGIFRGYATDSEAFVISWGGGHEAGPCIQSEDILKAFERCAPMKAGSSSMIFFNLSHVGPDLPEKAEVILAVYNEKSGQVIASLPIQIKKPEVSSGAVQFQKSDPGQWRPFGNVLPKYDSRWWPQKTVIYETDDELPLLLQRDGLDLFIQWDNRVIATISDHTEPTILDTNNIAYELFAFDQWHVALRLWFFWLDKKIGSDFFISRHEVPDAERFDLLIRKSDGWVSLACTDLHWRETWGIVEENKLLRATLGLGLETIFKLAEENLGKLWDTWKGEKQAEHKRPYNPLEHIIRTAETIGKKQGKITKREKGLESHLPALHNVTQTDDGNRPPRMTSSDVRLG